MLRTQSRQADQNSQPLSHLSRLQLLAGNIVIPRARNYRRQPAHVSCVGSPCPQRSFAPRRVFLRCGPKRVDQVFHSLEKGATGETGPRGRGEDVTKISGAPWLEIIMLPLGTQKAETVNKIGQSDQLSGFQDAAVCVFVCLVVDHRRTLHAYVPRRQAHYREPGQRLVSSTSCAARGCCGETSSEESASFFTTRL